MTFFQLIYEQVKLIPLGKVATYGQISRQIRLKYHETISPQLVGWALHHNPDPVHIPCHRVVNRKGQLAPKFAFGGPTTQRQLLLNEGIAFLDSTTVNLSQHQFVNQKSKY